MKKKKAVVTNRREFLVGAVAGLTCSTLSVTAQTAVTQISGRIEHNSTLCAGCGVCSLMCSLYHEHETNAVLSRSELVRNPLEGDFSLNTCRQCLSPSCYQSCPRKDSALCIDKKTGVKYINSEKCDGCGKCTQACPLKPARVKLSPFRKVVFKCDLCREREKGPICVEYCGQHALSIGLGIREA